MDALISPAPEVCTSALVNGRLRSAFTEWAVVGCFGDNLDTTADTLIDNLSSSVDRDALKQLGICVNYNAYGSQPADLHFHPADLYRRMQCHTSPTALLQDDRDLFETLVAAYETDMSAARRHLGLSMTTTSRWCHSRRGVGTRVSGCMATTWLTSHRTKRTRSDGYRRWLFGKVRAPLNNRTGADAVCRQFETGGGRAAAAGINQLPRDQLGRFIDALRAQYA